MTTIDIFGIVCSAVVIGFFILMAVIMLTPAVSSKEMNKIVEARSAAHRVRMEAR